MFMGLMDYVRMFRRKVNRFWRRRKLRKGLGNEEAGDQVADLFDRVEAEVDSSHEFEVMMSESDSLRELEERLNRRSDGQVDERSDDEEK